MLEYLLVANENDDEAAADALIEFVERRARAFPASEAREEGAAAVSAADSHCSSSSSTNTGKSASRKAEAARKPFVNLIPYNPTSAGDKFG